MSDSFAPRFLSDGSDERALALKVMFHETIHASFEAKTVFWDNTNSIYISRQLGPEGGKSHQFIQVAELEDPTKHIPGDEMLGQAYAFDEGTISIDDHIVKHVDIPEDQMRLVSWDQIAPLTMQMSQSLAKHADTKIAIIAAKAARTAAKTKTVNGSTLTIHNGGNVVSRVGAGGVTDAYPPTETGAKNFRDDVAHLAQLKDEDDVPEEGRNLYILPYIRRVLGNDPTIFNKDFSRTRNDLNSRIVGELEGFNLIVTNRLPSQNFTSSDLGGSLESKYQGDFRYNGSVGQPVAVALCGASGGRSAIGVVNAGISTRLWFDPRRSTTFMYAGLWFGADVLDPECAGEIRVTAS